jgi:anthranilate 1,2-dioxygenase small subunit
MTSVATKGAPAGFELERTELRQARELRSEIEDFHNAYIDIVDGGDLERWIDFFADDCLYEVIARENTEQGLPVGLVYCEGRSMIRDRAYAVKHTQMFAPRYVQHFVSNVMVRSIRATTQGEEIRATSNYMLLQTLVESPTTIHQSGRYYDLFVRREGRLLLKARHCVYDTTLIANDLVYPV